MGPRGRADTNCVHALCHAFPLSTIRHCIGATRDGLPHPRTLVLRREREDALPGTTKRALPRAMRTVPIGDPIQAVEAVPMCAQLQHMTPLDTSPESNRSTPWSLPVRTPAKL